MSYRTCTLRSGVRLTGRTWMLSLALGVAGHATITAQGDPGKDAHHRVAKPPHVAPVADLPLIDLGPSSWTVVPISIGGRDSLWFIVDLGSTITLISPTTSEQLTSSLQDAGTMSGVGYFGSTSTPQVRIDSVRLGHAVKHGIVVGVVDIAKIASHVAADPSHPFAGLLGDDVLGEYDIEFNVPAGRLRLYPRTSPAPGDTAPVLPVAGLHCTPNVSGAADRGLVAVDALFAGHRVHAHIDTGARPTTASWGAAELIGVDEASPKLRADTVFGDRGVLDSVPIRVGGQVLALAPVHVRELPALVMTGEQLPIIGLGLPHLRDRILFVSHSTGQVCFGSPQPLNTRSAPRVKRAGKFRQTIVQHSKA